MFQTAKKARSRGHAPFLRHRIRLPRLCASTRRRSSSDTGLGRFRLSGSFVARLRQVAPESAPTITSASHYPGAKFWPNRRTSRRIFLWLPRFGSRPGRGIGLQIQGSSSPTDGHRLALSRCLTLALRFHRSHDLTLGPGSPGAMCWAIVLSRIVLPRRGRWLTETISPKLA